MSALVDQITEVLREVIRTELGLQTGEYFPSAVFDKAAAAVAEALQLTEEWGVQISYGETVISNNPMERPMAEAVVRRNYTGNAHLASRLISGWTAVEPKP